MDLSMTMDPNISFNDNLNRTFDKVEFNQDLEVSGIDFHNQTNIFEMTIRESEEFTSFIGGVEFTPDEKLGDINVIKKINYSTAVGTFETDDHFEHLVELHNSNEEKLEFEMKEKKSKFDDSSSSEEGGNDQEEENLSSEDYSFSEDFHDDLLHEFNQRTDAYTKKVLNRSLDEAFIEELTEEFSMIREDYEEKISSLRLRKSQLKIEVERCENIKEDMILPETRLKLYHKKFFSQIKNKFGEPWIVKSSKNLNITIITTINKKIIFYDLFQQQIFEFGNKEKSQVSVVTFNEKTFDILLGFKNGALRAIHYDEDKFKFENWMKVNKKNEKKILEICVLGRKMASVVYLDEDMNLMYAPRRGKGKSAKFDFFKIPVKIIKSEHPHIKSLFNKSTEIIIVTSNTTTYIFEHIFSNNEKLKKNPLTLLQKFRTPLASSIKHEGVFNKNPEIEGFPIFMPKITTEIEQDEEDSPSLETNDYLCVLSGFHILFYKFESREEGIKEKDDEDSIELEIEKKDKEDKDIISFQGYVEINSRIIFGEKFDKEKIGLIDSNNHISFYSIKKQIKAVRSKSRIINISSPLLLKSIEMLKHTLENENPEKKSNEFERQDSLKKLKSRKKNRNFRFSESEIQEIVTVVNSKLKPDHSVENFDKKFSQSFFFSGGYQRILMLNRKGLWIYEKMGWEDYLEELVKEGYYKLGIRTVYELIKQRNSTLRETPNPEEIFSKIGPYLKSLVKACIPHFVKIEIPELKKIVNMVIYLLIKTGLFEFMDDEFYLLMKDLGKLPLYLEALKIFYERQIIPVLSLEKVKLILDMLKRRDSGPIHQNLRNKFLKVVFDKRQHRDFCIANTIENNNFYLLVYFIIEHEPDSILIPVEMIRIKVDNLKKKTNIDEEKKLKKKVKILKKLYWYLEENLVGCFNNEECDFENNRQQNLRLLSWIVEGRSSKWLQKRHTGLYFKFLARMIKNGLIEVFKKYKESHYLDYLRDERDEEVQIFTEDSEKFTSIILENCYKKCKEQGQAIFYLLLAVISVSKYDSLEVTQAFKKLAFINLLERLDFVIHLNLVQDDILFIVLILLFRDIKKSCENDPTIKVLLKKSQ